MCALVTCLCPLLTSDIQRSCFQVRSQPKLADGLTAAGDCCDPAAAAPPFASEAPESHPQKPQLTVGVSSYSVVLGIKPGPQLQGPEPSPLSAEYQT